ncbi:MAG: hypothetical protein M0Z85_12830 [Gammaproteobacteria bacterium]|nr:hypothetical protein [Gammaproteobacteria bacterium]
MTQTVTQSWYTREESFIRSIKPARGYRSWLLRREREEHAAWSLRRVWSQAFRTRSRNYGNYPLFPDGAPDAARALDLDPDLVLKAIEHEDGKLCQQMWGFGVDWPPRGDFRFE